MKVERIDVFDFKITLNESEFSDIRDVCEFDNTPIDDVVCSVIEKGFDVLHNGETEKE